MVVMSGTAVTKGLLDVLNFRILECYSWCIS